MTNEIVKSENAVATYSNEEIKLIHDRFAKNATEKEFELFLYTANKYQLDPLVKQIWCVKFAGQDAQIYAGRDGFLEIAHRSGQFNGLESGMKDEKTAYAKVFRKDMDNPFYVEVDMAEYNTNQALWKSKPITMLTKVAESQALRRAFSITGIYSPEEMGQWELQEQGINFDKTPPPKAVTPLETL
jgi:phage recombination protein Bet